MKQSVKSVLSSESGSKGRVPEIQVPSSGSSSTQSGGVKTKN